MKKTNYYWYIKGDGNEKDKQCGIFFFFFSFAFLFIWVVKKRKEKKVRGKLEGKVLFQLRKWVSSVGRIASGTERKLL